MLPDRVSNLGPQTYESGALPIALRGPAILLEIHLTEHGRFHFQGRTTFYTPVLVQPSRHMTSKGRRCDVMTSHRCQYNVISMSCTCRAVI